MKYNDGNCFFCDEPVYTSDGQLQKVLIKNGVEFPVHKKCRKSNEKKHKK